MAKSRVTMQPTRAREVSTQSVKMLNPDAWREGLTTAQRGYGYRWKKFRASYLLRHPLCVACAADGKVVEATVVDHVIPHRGDQKLFWAGPFQALCASCHGRKAVEEGGIGWQRKG